LNDEIEKKIDKNNEIENKSIKKINKKNNSSQYSKLAT
jgi:hypothetical protein